MTSAEEEYVFGIVRLYVIAQAMRIAGERVKIG